MKTTVDLESIKDLLTKQIKKDTTVDLTTLLNVLKKKKGEKEEKLNQDFGTKFDFGSSLTGWRK